MTKTIRTVLHVEDDPDDVFLLGETFKDAGLDCVLQVARDGEEAVDYLLGRAAYADRNLYPPPFLVLLDLKLPRKSGLEVLEWRLQQPDARRIPLIVLTSSQSNDDLSRAYELGTNSYLVKPVDAAAQLKMVKAIGAYWLDHNKVPEARTPKTR